MNQLAQTILFHNLLKIRFSSENNSGIVKQVYLRLDYSIKVSFIYQQKGNIKNKKIGFSLYKTSNRRYDIYHSDQQVIRKWMEQLSKYVFRGDFLNDFKSIKYIGRGQFGQVWQVQRNQDNKKFAAKIIDKSQCFGKVNGEQSLYNQIQILKKINHPNIPKLQSIYQSERSIYILLEYIDGQNFLQFVNKRQRVQKENIRSDEVNQQNVKIMKELLKTVHYLHRNGIVHRDLKPGNIIIDLKDLRPHIIDFGLSQNIKKQNYQYACCGSPGYIAPELFEDRQISNIEKSDVFSIGGLFFLLLTGKHLAEGNSTEQVINFTKDKYLINKKIKKYLQYQQKNFVLRLVENDSKKRLSAEQALNHDFLVQNIFHELQDLRKNHQNTSISSKYTIRTKNMTSKFQQLFNQSIIVLENKFNLSPSGNIKQNLESSSSNLVSPSKQFNQKIKYRSKRYLSEQNIEIIGQQKQIKSLVKPFTWSGKWRNFHAFEMFFRNMVFV